MSGRPLLASAALCLLLGCGARSADRPDASGRGAEPVAQPTVRGRGGAAATVDARATAAAIEVLQEGGNAVDAAIAASAVIGVTDPFSCGIGGGGFMVLYRAETRQVLTVDSRETAPRALTAARFYENGAPIPFSELMTSGLSTGVPGTVQGWEEAQRRYGRLTLKEVLRPAIRTARHGFTVDPTFVEQTRRNLERFRAVETTRRLFLTDKGEPHPVGSTFRNPELADAYTLLAAGGAQSFYEGAIAEEIVRAVTQPPVARGATPRVRPGVMTLEDLAYYEARIRPPVTATWRGYTLYGMGPPSSGGLMVPLALHLLEDGAPGTRSRAEHLHRYIEASRLAFADRNAYLADPEFIGVPVEGLLSPAYAAERRQHLSPTRAASAAVAPGDPFRFQGGPEASRPFLFREPVARSVPEPGAMDPETTHITTVDADGNIVANTCTIEAEGGNAVVVRRFGFLLNNELTDFNVPATPGEAHPNRAEPGKRPRSSIAPTLVFKDGVPVLALGSPGGATIITTVLQTLVNHFELGLPIDEALAAPRVSQLNAANGASLAEPEFLASPEAAVLQGMGHTFTPVPEIGALTAIRLHGDGTHTAAAEPRRRGGGSAQVVAPLH